MPLIHAWHGTNQSFETFDQAFLGLSTRNGASRSAFFFAMREDTARAYAVSAAAKLVPEQARHEERVRQLIEQAERASARRDYRASERLYMQAEELEFRAIQAPPQGARVLQCALRLDNPLEVDGLSRAVVTDLGAVLAAARKAGHDGVIIRDIADTPAGGLDPDDHVAVFDAARITILETRPALPEPEDLPCP